MPDSGGRFLVTEATCEDLTSKWEGKYSDWMKFLHSKETEPLIKTLPLTRVDLPPWSVLFGRGDFLHAGRVGRSESSVLSPVSHVPPSRECAFCDSINPQKTWQVGSRK
eukprot:IDg1806t1